ncbi:MAG: hypothetical protein CMJ49_03465 [Planctomycetaceae bacterium]|nr:hypothetical protein [Planctomycetaceae bacterium]
MCRDTSWRLYDDGRHYDRALTIGGEHASGFWLDQARQNDGPVLEMACGTGAVAIPLARAGHDVTGFDLSEAMLDEAKRKSEAAGVAVDWRQGDMRGFDLGRRYGLIILASNALCHLLDLPALEGCLRCVRDHLLEAGVFALTVFVPDQAQLKRRCDEAEEIGAYEDPDGRGHVVMTGTYEYDPATQIKHITTRHRVGDSETLGTLDLRMYYPQELVALLKYNGFEVLNRWGNQDGAAFGPDSKLQVIVCRAANRFGRARSRKEMGSS